MLLRVPFLAVCLFFSGCANVVGGSRPAHVIRYYPEGVESTLVMDEINAAASLDFESTRVAHLASIAQRPTLLPAEQVHLVYVALHRLSFESSRHAVVNDLIANPAFCEPAKRTILRYLDRFSFDSTKSQILTAMENRPVRILPPPMPGQTGAAQGG